MKKRILCIGTVRPDRYSEFAQPIDGDQIEKEYTPLDIHLEHLQSASEFEWHVVTPVHKLDRPWVSFESEGVMIWLVRFRSDRPWKDRYAAEKVWTSEVFKRVSGHIVHAIGPSLPGVMAVETRLPLIYSIQKHPPPKHVLDHENRLAHQWENRLIHSANFSVAPIPSLQRHGEQISHRSVHVLFPFLPTDVQQRMPNIRRKPTRRSLLARTDSKSISYLLDAFRKLLHQLPDMQLVLTGLDVKAQSRFGSALRKKNLSGSVSYCDAAIGSESWCDQLQRSAAVIDLKREPGPPTLLLSAMALGIPVVGKAESAPHCWALQDGQSGLLNNSHSPANLCKHMIDAINPPRSILQKTAESIRTLLDPERLRGEWVDLYQQTIHETNISG